VLVGGYMRGVWETETRQRQTVVRVTMFPAPETGSTPASAAIKKGIAAEAERMSAFLNTKVMVEYENI
jgi:hypothetical protein